MGLLSANILCSSLEFIDCEVSSLAKLLKEIGSNKINEKTTCFSELMFYFASVL
ncbi:hypothetical protein GAPWKB30_1372 [Gilliamella apicola]|nr:hypothetical protein GAPWKB30_1372 [Gilliamella apicola]